MPPRRTLLAGALALAAAACGDPAERSTSWGYLHATIIEPSCATAACHSAVSKLGGPLESILGVDLSTPDAAYKSLTGIDLTETDRFECRDHFPYDVNADEPIPADELTWLARAGDEPPAPDNVNGVIGDPDYPLMLLLRGVPWCPDPDIHGSGGSAGFDNCVRASEEQHAELQSNNPTFSLGPAYEVQMPPDRPLPDGEIRLIREWIREGAPCD